MEPFPVYDVAEKLGITPIAYITDEQIWNTMVTPQVKAYLGDIVVPAVPTEKDTIAGFFPGDEAFNFNEYPILSNGQPGTRCYYLSTFYKTKYGAFVIKRDGVKIMLTAWYGDVNFGHGELMFLTALRDRCYDGTKRANDSALANYRNDDPVFHKQLSPDAKSLEISIYSYVPGSKIVDVTGDQQYHDFVAHPFTFVSDPELFLKLFWRAWEGKRAPGQYATQFPDVSKLVLPGYEKIARSVGYDFLEACPSHYHVARWFHAGGYCYNNAEDAAILDAIAKGFRKIRQTKTLTRTQLSWLCVLQSLPADLIPEDLHIGVSWPQDNLSLRYLWMHKAIGDRAKAPCHLPDPE